MKYIFKAGLVGLITIYSFTLLAEDIDSLLEKAYSELAEGKETSVADSLNIFEEAAKLGSSEAAHAAGLIYLE